MKLSPLKKEQPKRVFATFDIESQNWTKFIVAGYYNGEDYIEFKSLKKFLDFLFNDKTDIIKPTDIFAHFGGKFDFLFIIKEVLKHDEIKITEIVPRGSSILYLGVTYKSRSYTFRDSSALLPFSLKAITENFDVATKKGDWDHSKTKGYSKELGEYLKSDCIGLHQAIEKYYNWPLIQRAGGATTQASQAIRILRTYIKNDIEGLGKQQTNFCRKAFLGGRTEIFNLYCREKIYEYDVNSLYPFVMRENYFPVGSGINTFTFERKKLGIYRAKVSAPENIHIPVLGIVRDGKYIFPVGTFEGHWTNKELIYAESLGYKIKPMNGIVFKNSEKIFENYIDDLYKIRETSPKNSVSNVIAKLLLNASYGRFGMNVEKENIGFDLKEGIFEYATLKVLKKKIQLYKEPVTLNTFTHCGIAAFVTSYARIHMHKLMHALGDTLYYTDTDSLWTTTKIEESSKIGGLKLAGTYDEGAVFLLPKTYMAVSKILKVVKMKGFDSKKIKHFTIDDFRNALEGDLHRFKIINEPKFATFKSALAQKKIVTMTKRSEKQLRSLYNKRTIVRDNGNYFTKPLRFEE